MFENPLLIIIIIAVIVVAMLYFMNQKKSTGEESGDGDSQSREGSTDSDPESPGGDDTRLGQPAVIDSQENT